jgi:uncharacterized membrane protein (DUF106 family)
MWAAIFGVLASLPKFLELIEKFVDWLSNQIDLARKQKVIDELNQATSEAKETKDTSHLEELFDPGKKK